ncbi:MAG TPA: aminotransferase class I/II-fold pyridoxal phosphate-dependent enzyme [Chthoniobacterales bacterium]|nr:aminotransferase class I/II-fold pyridoxal phosphate-dependent enzyme [Chthoniobacterales bacterium]
MSQAFHGGQIRQAAERFGVPLESFVDFSSNVNVLAPAVTAADWERWMTEIYRYPEPADLTQRLASFYDVRAEHMLPTAGAIEALYLSARLFAGCRVAVIEPSFSDYSRAFSTIPCSVERILLTSELWASSIQDWADRLEPFDVIVLGNPNNPTGSFSSLADLTALFDRRWVRPKHWIIDEAFIEFVTESERETLLNRLTDYPSLIVLRSLTKSWRIPGLRFGFLATAGPIEELERIQPPWSVNGVVQAWASEFLRYERRSEYLASLRMLVTLREDFQARLRLIPGITVYPSAANFLLLELTDAGLHAEQVYSKLGCRGILIRVCDSFYGMPKGRFLRIAIRTASENRKLVEVLSEICAALRGNTNDRFDALDACSGPFPLPITSHQNGRTA